MYVCMKPSIKTHNAEIRAIMQRSLNGEMNEADAARTIILLQREFIRGLMDLSSLNDAPAGLMEETTHQTKNAA